MAIAKDLYHAYASVKEFRKAATPPEGIKPKALWVIDLLFCRVTDEELSFVILLVIVALLRKHSDDVCVPNREFTPPPLRSARRAIQCAKPLSKSSANFIAKQ